MSPVEDKVQRLEKLINDGRVEVSDVRSELDKFPAEQVRKLLPQGQVTTVYAESMNPSWKVGDGRPVYADEDPATMAAMGRCATARVLWSDKMRSIGIDHHGICGWCDAPLVELLKALDWFTWWSKLVMSARVSWTSAGVTYTRPLPSGHYENPRVAAFVAMSRDEQTLRVERVLAASRVTT